MKCPKCGNKKFIIAITEYGKANYFVEVEDDGRVETLQECGNTYHNDIEYPNTVECSKCGEIVTIPGELSNEKQNSIRKEAKNQWETTEEIFQIPDDAKVEHVDDGYWVEARVWIREEE